MAKNWQKVNRGCPHWGAWPVFHSKENYLWMSFSECFIAIQLKCSFLASFHTCHENQASPSMIDLCPDHIHRRTMLVASTWNFFGAHNYLTNDFALIHCGIRSLHVCRQLSEEVDNAKAVDTSNTIFTKILNKEIPAVILHEDEKVCLKFLWRCHLMLPEFTCIGPWTACSKLITYVYCVHCRWGYFQSYAWSLVKLLLSALLIL